MHILLEGQNIYAQHCFECDESVELELELFINIFY